MLLEMSGAAKGRLHFLDNLRTFLIFLVVLYHSGLVYESSGVGATFWVVDDPSTSAVPGLVNLVIGTFVMATIFFIAGYLTPSSLDGKGEWRFLKTKFRRLMVPWALAVFTLMPLYKVLFLYSRGLPQESWTRYFHFSNGTLGMNWLWFLPVLFLFDCLYVALRRLRLPTSKLSLGMAVGVVLVAGVTITVLFDALGWRGWTMTPVIDFQRELLLTYFMVFLLGALCYRLGTLDSADRNMKLYIAVNSTAWLPVTVYLVFLLRRIFKPGEFLISEGADRLLYWLGFHLSSLALLYCAVTTFKYYFNRQGRLGRALGGHSFGVYVVHVIVLAPIALALLEVDVSPNLKYVILTLGTYAGSNLLAWAHAYGMSRVSA